MPNLQKLIEAVQAIVGARKLASYERAYVKAQLMRGLSSASEIVAKGRKSGVLI